MKTWSSVKLGDIATILAGGDLPKKAFSKTKTDVYAVPIYSNGISDKGLYGYTNKATITKPATTISARGTIGAVFKRTEPYLPIVRLISVIGDESVVDSDFLYYALCNTRIEGDGSVQAQLTVPMISDYCITIPPLQTQKRIARILSSLDDKIELNNQINRDLEEQAKAIFKSWFVDFDPFQNGEFIESELGPIPVGWRIVAMNEITKEQRNKVGIHNLKVLSAVNTGKLMLSEDYFSKQVFSKDTGNYIIVKPLDFAYNPARVNIGSIGMNEMGYSGCVSPVYVVFSTEEGYHHFMNFLIKRPSFREEIKTRCSGSVRQSLNYRDFGLIKTVYPPHEVIEQFNKVYEPFRAVINHNQIESVKLQETRDTLLPKLMSGEIDRNLYRN